MPQALSTIPNRCINVTASRSVSRTAMWTIQKCTISVGCYRSCQYDRYPKPDQRIQLWKPIWYLSMEASIPLAATIEHVTFAPLEAALQLREG